MHFSQTCEMFFCTQRLTLCSDQMCLRMFPVTLQSLPCVEYESAASICLLPSTLLLGGRWLLIRHQVKSW